MTIAAPTIRCAIYARNHGTVARRSLASQRALCRAYINSRRHAGWIALPAQYSDRQLSSTGHGFPALKRLLVQVEHRRIDRLVIDRLSCICTCASDLNRIMMLLDHGGCSLVVAGQAIDGATPVGRQVLVTLGALAPALGKPELTRRHNAADQQRALAALMRLRRVQSLHAPAINTQGHLPCGS